MLFLFISQKLLILVQKVSKKSIIGKLPKRSYSSIAFLAIRTFIVIAMDFKNTTVYILLLYDK
jgi:hypothetical protein